MFSLGRLLSATGIMAIIAAYSPACAQDNQLQPEFDVSITDNTKPDYTAPQYQKKPVKAEIFLDDELPDAPDLDDIPFLTARENGAYLRADIGFGAPFVRHALTANGVFNPTLSGPALFGMGIGYEIGHMLRAEVAAEYRSRSGIQTADGVRAHTIGGQLLASVYADIGTWYGVTPYIGAGAGLGWNKLSFAATFRDQNKSDFIWALSGGFAVKINPKLTFDIGYRYIDAGTHHSSSLMLRESGSHDLRIGLRWRLERQTF